MKIQNSSSTKTGMVHLLQQKDIGVSWGLNKSSVIVHRAIQTEVCAATTVKAK